MRGRPVRADLEENITVSRGLAPQRHRGTRSQRLGKGTQRLKGPLHSKELVKSHMVTHWVPEETSILFITVSSAPSTSQVLNKC